MKCDFGAPRGAAARRRAAEIKNAGAIVSRCLCTLCLGGKVGEPPWGRRWEREGARAWGATSPAGRGNGGRGRAHWARPAPPLLGVRWGSPLGGGGGSGRGRAHGARPAPRAGGCPALVLALCCDFFGGRAPRRAWGKTPPCGSGFGAGKRARRQNEIEQW